MAGITEEETRQARFDGVEEDILQLTIQSREVHARPKIFHDTTYNLDAEARANAVMPLIERTRKEGEGLYTAGYIQVSGQGRAVIDTWGRAMYYPYTKSQYSVTVRDARENGSGWAGVDWNDWSRVEAMKLTEIAIDKCLRSRNPVAVEPGRYTAILEPQAVFTFVANMIRDASFQRKSAEEVSGNTWNLSRGRSKIGLKVFDDQITISADPNDAELGFPPFDLYGNVYHPATWFENGVLKELPYNRRYAVEYLGENKGLPNSGAFRMEGGSSSVEEMIETTKRGILVTRFSNPKLVPAGFQKDPKLISGFTRDGLWLIENGRISKAIKNFRFVDSILFMFNNLESLGPSVRVFSPDSPAFVPSAKVYDFNFVSLIDAV